MEMPWRRKTSVKLTLHTPRHVRLDTTGGLEEARMLQHSPKVSSLLALATLLLPPGCALEPPSTDDIDSYPAGPLHPDTTLVEELPGFESVAVADDLNEIVVTFAGNATDSGIEPGRIVAGVGDGGYLRRVEAVSTDGNVLTITAGHATLAEAVTDVRISEVFTWGERHMIEFTGQTLYSSDRGSVVIERGIVHIDPKFNLDAELGFFSLKSATATLDMAISQDIEVSYEAAATLSSEGVSPLETVEFLLEGRAGLLTFTGTLEVTVSLGFSHQAEGPMSARQTIETNGHILSGGTYTKSGDTWEPIWEPEYTGQVSSEEYSGSSWQGRVWIEVDSKVHFDKIEGSTAHLEPSLSGWAESDCDQVTWGATGGITGSGVMELGFFSSGPRTEALPALNIEADSVEATRAHETPPVGCGEGPIDPVDPGPGTDPLFPLGGCAPLALVSCGDTISGDTRPGVPGTTSAFDGYSCSVGNYGAAEATFAVTVPQNAEVTVEFEGAHPTEVNHDLFVLESPPSLYTCSPASCISMGYNAVSFDALGSSTYYLVVDGDNESPGAFEATISCN
jgi:hypothetical protein